MSKVSKFNISLVFVICLLCVLCCGYAFADGTDDNADYTEVPVYVDGLLSCRGYSVGEETYVSLDAICGVLGYDSASYFDKETNTLTVKVANITVTACADDKYLTANGRCLYLPDGYKEIGGTPVFPLEAVAKIFTLELKQTKYGAFDFSTANEAILESGDEYYDEEDLYWMSRVITWESGNQLIEGQIGVGNVVLNRIEDGRFENTVKDVIFQPGQFIVVARKAIYGDPYEISIAAAKMALEGYNTVDDAVFFQACRSGDNWMCNNTEFVITIDDHSFFR